MIVILYCNTNKDYKILINTRVLALNTEHIQNRNFVSDHQKFPIPSKILNAYMTDQLYIVQEFVKYCNRENITYSIVGGAVIGYYCHHTLLPWDDDIDIAIVAKDEHIVENLWKNGTDIQMMIENWQMKQIVLNCKRPFYMGKSITGGWYKLLTDKYVRSTWFKPYVFRIITKDVGGVDVNVALQRPDGRWVEKPFPQNNICDMNDLTLVNLHGVLTNMPKKQNAYQFLDTRYGDQWRQDITRS
jgi:hypothetical protein